MKMLVAGAGRTGVAVANRMASFGDSVTLTDAKPADALKDILQALRPDVRVVAGGHNGLLEESFDMVVTSPGIPWDNSLLESFRGKGTEVISEIELAFRYLKQDWIAITGTNGKTTTTTLVGAILEEAGISSLVCGNIGNAVMGENVLFSEKRTVVAEISSFQLEGVTTFAPKVSAILNITPDHLDRHHSMENYISLKSRIFEKQADDGWCVLNLDDPETANLATKVNCRLAGFSTRFRPAVGAWVEDGTIRLAMGGKVESIGQVSDLKLIGQANLENALAACAISACAGAGAFSIGKALFGFQPLKNRMELVANINGVRYVNDSKATNVHSALKGIEGLEGNFFVILGGRDKEGDFAPLAELVKSKGGTAVLIGEAGEKISRSFVGYGKVFDAGYSMVEAIRFCTAQAQHGDTVILSPACASFDMFRNYEDRGDTFRRIVLGLGDGGLNA